MGPRTLGALHCGHCGLRLDAASDPSAPFAPGHRVAGRYEVGMPLGRTGYGLILAAWDGLRDQRCALSECLVLEGAAADADAARELATLFARAGAAAPAADPVFAPVLDFVAEDGLGYFTLSYEDGEALATMASLQETLDGRGRPYEPAEATALLEPVMAAMERRHASGRLHGLLGPDNVFLGPSGPRILDFGPASLADGAPAGVKAALAPAAAPPEIAAGRPAGAPTDVYLLAALVYQASTGRAPARAFAAPTAMGVTSDFRFALEKSLESRPSDRIASVRALRDALAKGALPAAAAAPGRDRRGLLVALLGMAGLVVAGAGAWWLWPDGPQPGEPSAENEPADPVASEPALGETVPEEPASFDDPPPTTALDEPASDDSPPLAAAPVIRSFTAEPERVLVGAPVDLYWNVSGEITSLRLEPGGEVAARSGSKQMRPDRLTTYQLTARGPGGEAVKTVLVEVVDPSRRQRELDLLRNKKRDEALKDLLGGKDP